MATILPHGQVAAICLRCGKDFGYVPGRSGGEPPLCPPCVGRARRVHPNWTRPPYCPGCAPSEPLADRTDAAAPLRRELRLNGLHAPALLRRTK